MIDLTPGMFMHACYMRVNGIFRLAGRQNELLTQRKPIFKSAQRFTW